MKISIKQDNNRERVFCASPPPPTSNPHSPPRNLTTHPMCRIEDVSFCCKISSSSSLEFALCPSSSLPLKKRFSCVGHSWDAPTNHFSFGEAVLAGRSTPLSPTFCSGPGLRTPLLPAPLPSPPSPHFPLCAPASHSVQGGSVSLSTVSPGVL